ncbi:SGNH/GDSL hydrolase family protein [Mucilaginibacter sp. E4BP6]|uniref:SGNH/GDSL hydrolase family protein n=1 Tax=Mucilaginibacter sp. E4BP6 TaxID=2723089 RepID=UPI0015CE81C5|nr:SGNH/GDSL hydrolase family protein [Mucilaginibacter sp. E4BP6]NYE66925.1 lysophospholipase L1-like esterase [Mucilaginibacter sp. E4BP6]
MKKIILFILVLLNISDVFAQHKTLTWMAIGSSSTYMNGKPELTKNRMTEGYMDRVVDKLPYIKYVNHGHSGWTTKSIADNIDKLGLEKADFYSVLLGSNDWWLALPLGTLNDYTNNTGNRTMYGAYKTIINKIRSLNSNAIIILITPSQRTDYVDVNNKASFIYGCYKPKDGHYLSEYADVVKSIAKAENFELVDVYYKSGITFKNAVKYRRLRDPKSGAYKNYKYPDYINIPYNPATDDYPYPVDAIGMTYDGLHPSNKGYAKIAKMLVKVMRKY